MNGDVRLKTYENDLSIWHFTVTTPGTDTIEYRDSLQNIIDNISSETNTCYTDGSRTNSGSGAGYIITTDNKNTTLEERSFKLPDYCTVHQTELTAISSKLANISQLIPTLTVYPRYKLFPCSQRGVERLETVMTPSMHSDPLTL